MEVARAQVRASLDRAAAGRAAAIARWEESEKQALQARAASLDAAEAVLKDSEAKLAARVERATGAHAGDPWATHPEAALGGGAATATTTHPGGASADASAGYGFNPIRARVTADGRPVPATELEEELASLRDRSKALDDQEARARRELAGCDHGADERAVWETTLLAVADSRRVVSEQAALLELELEGRRQAARLKAARAEAAATGAARLRRARRELEQARSQSNACKRAMHFPDVKGYHVRFGGGNVFGATQDICISEVRAGGRFELRPPETPGGEALFLLEVGAPFANAERGAHGSESRRGRKARRAAAKAKAEAEARAAAAQGGGAGIRGGASAGASPGAGAGRAAAQGAGAGAGRPAAVSTPLRAAGKSLDPRGAGAPQPSPPPSPHLLASRQPSGGAAARPAGVAAPMPTTVDEAVAAIPSTVKARKVALQFFKSIGKKKEKYLHEPPPGTARSRLGQGASAGDAAAGGPQGKRSLASRLLGKARNRTGMSHGAHGFGSERSLAGLETASSAGGGAHGPDSPSASSAADGASVADLDDLDDLDDDSIFDDAAGAQAGGARAPGTPRDLARGGSAGSTAAFDAASGPGRGTPASGRSTPRHGASGSSEARAGAGGARGSSTPSTPSGPKDLVAGLDAAVGDGQAKTPDEILAAALAMVRVQEDGEGTGAGAGAGTAAPASPSAPAASPLQAPPTPTRDAPGPRGAPAGAGAAAAGSSGAPASPSPQQAASAAPAASTPGYTAGVDTDAWSGCFSSSEVTKGAYARGRTTGFALLGAKGSKIPNLSIGLADVAAEVYLRFELGYSKERGWRSRGEPAFTVHRLWTRLVDNSVPMPSALVRRILTLAIPGVIEKRILEGLSRELGEYLLAAKRGGFVEGDVTLVGPDLAVLDADMSLPEPAAAPVAGPNATTGAARAGPAQASAAAPPGAAPGASAPGAPAAAADGASKLPSERAVRARGRAAAARSARELLGLTQPAAAALAEAARETMGRSRGPSPLSPSWLISLLAAFDHAPAGELERFSEALSDATAQLYAKAIARGAVSAASVATASSSASAAYPVDVLKLLRGPVAELRAKPGRARAVVRRVDAGVDVDALLAAMRDYTRRVLEDLFVNGEANRDQAGKGQGGQPGREAAGRGQGAQPGRDAAAPSGSSSAAAELDELREQIRVLDAWHTWATAELRHFGSRFVAGRTTVVAAASRRSFSVGLEDAVYEGPMRVSVPLDVACDEDGALSFSLPLPSPQGRIGTFVDEFKALTLPAHLRSPASAVNWADLPSDPRIRAAIRDRTDQALGIIGEVVAALRERHSDDPFEPAETALSLPRTPVGDVLGRFIFNRLVARFRLDEQRLIEVLRNLGVFQAAGGTSSSPSAASAPLPGLDASDLGRMISHLGDVAIAGLVPAPRDPRAPPDASPGYVLRLESSAFSRLSVSIESVGFESAISPGGMVRLVHALTRAGKLAFGRGVHERDLDDLRALASVAYEQAIQPGLELSAVLRAEGVLRGGHFLVQLSGKIDPKAPRETAPIVVTNDLGYVQVGKMLRGDHAPREHAKEHASKA